jgi:hypothetical protein
LYRLNGCPLALCRLDRRSVTTERTRPLRDAQTTFFFATHIPRRWQRRTTTPTLSPNCSFPPSPSTASLDLSSVPRAGLTLPLRLFVQPSSTSHLSLPVDLDSLHRDFPSTVSSTPQPNMRTSTPALFLSFLAPSFVAASWWDGSRPNQLAFDSPSSSSGSLLHHGAVPPHPARPSPSVVVHLVDPASPSTSSLPSALTDEGDEAEDAPNFGQPCQFESVFQTCGDVYDEASGLDHGLFCSPAGVCGGRGAACGATEACGEGAFSFHRFRTTRRSDVDALLPSLLPPEQVSFATSPLTAASPLRPSSYPSSRSVTQVVASLLRLRAPKERKSALPTLVLRCVFSRVFPAFEPVLISSPIFSAFSPPTTTSNAAGASVSAASTAPTSPTHSRRAAGAGLASSVRLPLVLSAFVSCANHPSLADACSAGFRPTKQGNACLDDLFFPEGH